jgi:hypothetical protein
MANKNSIVKIGSWAFLLGAIIAVVAGILSPGGATSTITTLLIILGLIVGLLNVTQKETTSFLIAAVSLAIVTAFGGEVLREVAGIGPYLEGVLAAILTFVIPAAIIVALKSIYALASEE